MRRMTAALALGGACAASCALPLAGMFAAAGGAACAGGAAGVAVAAGAGALAWYLLRRRQAPAHPAVQPSASGCAPSSSKNNDSAEEAIACTLQADGFKSRAAWIRGIADRHHRKSMRSPLTLYLVYAPEAADDVRELVRKEGECCAFLRFDLWVADDAVHLLITAP